METLLTAKAWLNTWRSRVAVVLLLRFLSTKVVESLFNRTTQLMWLFYNLLNSHMVMIQFI